jgi:uncharacterized protein (DUF3084 family)
MMNLDPVPPIPAMNTAAVQFLDLLADPKAARKLMDDLVATHAKASAAHDEATKARGEVIGKQNRLDQEKRDFEQHRAAHSAFLKQSGDELDKRHNAAHEREMRLAEANAAHDERDAKIAAREAAVQSREDQMMARERELTAAKTSHDARVSRINRVVEHFDQGIAVWRE